MRGQVWAQCFFVCFSVMLLVGQYLHMSNAYYNCCLKCSSELSFNLELSFYVHTSIKLVIPVGTKNVVDFFFLSPILLVCF